MPASKKIVKYKKTHFNIGAVIFVVLLLYIIFVSVHFFRKEHISIYEVTEKQMSDDNSATGIAIRNETVYSSSMNGVVALYNTKDRKVSNGASLFSVDSSGTSADLLSAMDNETAFSNEDIADIRTTINEYRYYFDPSNYQSAVDFKNEVEGDVFSIISDLVIGELSSKHMEQSSSFAVSYATESGIVSYWSDGMENISIDSITSKTFDNSEYKKKTIKTSDTVAPGDIICKVATSEDWDLVVMLSEEQYKKLEEKKTVKIRFCSDSNETIVPFDLLNKNNEYYAILHFSNYLERYLEHRFINIELLLNSVDGLKIPKSSLLEKNCYMVPKEYLTKGGNSKKDILAYESIGSDNKPEIKELDSFCMMDDTNVYIDTSVIQPGTVFINQETNERYQVGEMTPLIGVYNVNKGFCQFKYVEILYENQEYCVIKKDTPYGLSTYDHIVINPELINENDIIYK